MKGTVVELTTEEMDELIQRIDAETLRDDDLPTIKTIIKAYLLVTQALQEKKTSIRKLLRMIFGPRTEKAKTVLAKIALFGKTPAAKGAKTGKESGEKSCGHGRKGASAYTAAVWNGYSVRSVRHADVLASGYNFKSGFGKCPDSPFSGNISEKHFRLEPRPDKRWLPLFLLLSFGGKL